MIRNILTATMLLSASALFAQQPDTDIYLVNMNVAKDGKIYFSGTKNITHRRGYDNQPAFSKDGSKVYYVSYHDTLQSDIYVYDRNDTTTTQLTNTPESEFSPRVTSDDLGFNIVRVDADKGQRFYKILMDGSNEQQLLGTTDSVAYYCKVNDTTIAAAILNNNSMDLNIYELPDEQFIPLAKNVGRCLAVIPDGDNEISYVDKADTNGYMLMTFSLNTGLMGSACKLMKGVEDYAWTKDGRLLCGKDGKLYMFEPAKPENGWTEIADFSKTIGDFYRITINDSNTAIALVAYTKDNSKAEVKTQTITDEPKEDKKSKRKKN